MRRRGGSLINDDDDADAVPGDRENDDMAYKFCLLLYDSIGVLNSVKANNMKTTYGSVAIYETFQSARYKTTLDHYHANIKLKRYIQHEMMANEKVGILLHTVFCLK